MKHKVTYSVVCMCQGEKRKVYHYNHLIPAYWRYLRLIKQFGQYGTMQFVLKGW